MTTKYIRSTVYIGISENMPHNVLKQDYQMGKTVEKINHVITDQTGH